MNNNPIFKQVALRLSERFHNIDLFLKKSGIYFVYVKFSINDESYLTLIYIGESDNMYERHHPHDRIDDFNKAAKAVNGQIVYSYAYIDSKDRVDVQFGLIFKVQPLLNNKGKDIYNGKAYIIKLLGDIKCLKSRYVVYSAENQQK